MNLEEQVSIASSKAFTNSDEFCLQEELTPKATLHMFLKVKSCRNFLRSNTIPIGGGGEERNEGVRDF